MALALSQVQPHDQHGVSLQPASVQLPRSNYPTVWVVFRPILPPPPAFLTSRGEFCRLLPMSKTLADLEMRLKQPQLCSLCTAWTSVKENMPEIAELSTPQLQLWARSASRAGAKGIQKNPGHPQWFLTALGGPGAWLTSTHTCFSALCQANQPQWHREWGSGNGK